MGPHKPPRDAPKTGVFQNSQHCFGTGGVLRTSSVLKTLLSQKGPVFWKHCCPRTRTVLWEGYGRVLPFFSPKMHFGVEEGDPKAIRCIWIDLSTQNLANSLPFICKLCSKLWWKSPQTRSEIRQCAHPWSSA